MVADDGKDLEASDQLALVLVESADEPKRSRAKEISEAILNQTPTLRRSIATAAWIEFKLGSFEVADGIVSPPVASDIITWVGNQNFPFTFFAFDRVP